MKINNPIISNNQKLKEKQLNHAKESIELYRKKIYDCIGIPTKYMNK